MPFCCDTAWALLTFACESTVTVIPAAGVLCAMPERIRKEKEPDINQLVHRSIQKWSMPRKPQNRSKGFDEVRWATMRKTSYDSRASFHGAPRKELLPAGRHLFRLVPMATGKYFEAVWWMPQTVFTELHDDANRAAHGGGRLFRNYVAQYMALPSGSGQLCIVEIALSRPVYAWVGQSAPLFDRPGGVQQVFLPNLADRGNPGTSTSASVVPTYWLKF